MAIKVEMVAARLFEMLLNQARPHHCLGVRWLPIAAVDVVSSQACHRFNNASPAGLQFMLLLDNIFKVIEFNRSQKKKQSSARFSPIKLMRSVSTFLFQTRTFSHIYTKASA